jgi:N,N'-diacetyllegionaminate synthase
MLNKIKPLHIASHIIGLDQPCFIAAEIGLNHNGDMDLARKSIDAAASAGANGVKFQNYITEDFLENKNLTYTYINDGKEIIESQWSMFKRCELAEAQLKELKSYCDQVGVIFFSTPTGKSGIQVLKDMDSALIKNGSDLLTNLDLIRCMAECGIPTVLSTGMSTEVEIADAVDAFRMAGGHDLILLHCTSSYPTPSNEINLKRIAVLAETYNCLSGFSDHSEGVLAAVGARALGACFIEKHFTLNKNLSGPDHRFSADPEEFKELVKAVRMIEDAMGTSIVKPTTSELLSRASFRLSCTLKVNLKANSTIQREDIIFLRPGTGIPPGDFNALVGRKIKYDLPKGHTFNWDDFK